MRIESKDWLVMQVGKKAVIAKARDENSAFLKDCYRESPYLLDITNSNVLVNLGKTLVPHKTIFGASTNAFRTAFEVEDCTVAVFCPVVDMDKLKRTVTRALKKVGSIVPGLLPARIEIYASKGMLRGQAQYKKGKSTVRIYTDTCDYEEDVWLHEFGHLLLDRAAKKVRAAWIKAYSKLLIVQDVDIALFNRTKKDIIENGPSFIKQLEDEYQVAAKEIFAWIKRLHNITVKDLQDLYDSGEDIKDYMPKEIIQANGFVDNDEEQYALKNFNEYFACSFAKYNMKQQIRNKNLMAKTIAWAKTNIKSETDEEEDED